MTLAFGLDAHARDIDAVGFTVHVDHELGRYAFTTMGRYLAGFRNRQQGFRGQGAGFTLFEELAANVREHGEGQDIFLATGQGTDVGTQLGHFRLEQVGRTHVDHFFAADRLAAQLLVDHARGLAVTTLQVQLHLVGDGLVALAGEHVEEGLGTDDLRGRGNQRREARSSRTRGISASTSFMRLRAPCSLSWLARLEIMPPGTWLTCTRVSTEVNSLSNWWYFLRTA